MMSLSNPGRGNKKRRSDTLLESQGRKKAVTIREKVSKNLAALGIEPRNWAPAIRERHREGIARIIYSFQADFLFRNLQQSDIVTSEAGGAGSSVSANTTPATLTPSTSPDRSPTASDAAQETPDGSSTPTLEGLQVRLEHLSGGVSTPRVPLEPPGTDDPRPPGTDDLRPPGTLPSSGSKVPSPGISALPRRTSSLAQGPGWFKTTPPPWFNSIERREENDEETEWRTEIWNALELVVPPNLLDNLAYGDVRGLYAAIILCSPPARKIESLQARLTGFTKGALSLDSFLDEVRELADQLSAIGHPPSAEQLRQVAQGSLGSTAHASWAWAQVPSSSTDSDPTSSRSKWQDRVMTASHYAAVVRRPPARANVARTATGPRKTPPKLPDYPVAQEYALTDKIRQQAIPPSDVRPGDMGIILPDPGIPRELHGRMGQVISLPPGRVRMQVHAEVGMQVHSDADPGRTNNVGDFLENLMSSGLPLKFFFGIPNHLAKYLLGLKSRGRYHALRVMTTDYEERHVLNAIFDCGANIFISAHESVFDKLRPCLAPRLVSVCGDGVDVLCTHWGYVTMLVGGERRQFEGYYCAYATDTTIVPAGWWDTLPTGAKELQYWFRGINHSLELWQKTSDGETRLGAYAREVSVSGDHSKNFRSDLEPAGPGRQRHVLYPMPDAWFELRQTDGTVRTQNTRSKTLSKADEEFKAADVEFKARQESRKTRSTTLNKEAAELKTASIEGTDEEEFKTESRPSISWASTAEQPPGPGKSRKPRPGGHSVPDEESDFLTEHTHAALTMPYDEWEKLPPLPPSAAEESEVIVWTSANRKEDHTKTLQQLKGLREFHHARGHRSPKVTALLYEWETGRRIPSNVWLNQVHCQPCDMSKIKDRSHPTRAAKPTEVGEEISADIIVGMPSSLSEFKHVGHWHDVVSNWGGVVPSKSRSMDQHLLYFIEHFELLVGRKLTRLKIDSGEFKSDDVRARLGKKGTSILTNLADVHSNMSIERRHRTLKEVTRALLTHGGAPQMLWEFAVVMANEILNRTPPAQALIAAGSPCKGNTRALTPWELVMNKGVKTDSKSMWRMMEPIFVRCVFYIEKPKQKNHTDRGVLGINLGPIPSVGNLDYHGYNVLNLETSQVVKARAITAYPGDFPFRTRLTRNITSSSGGENHDLEEDAETSAEPEEEKVQGVTMKGGRMNRPEKFPAGSLVMTTEGIFEVIKRYDDGDFCVRRPGTTTANGGSYTIGATNLWLESDYPGWNYDQKGNLTSKVAPTVQPIPRLVIPRATWDAKYRPKPSYYRERNVPGPAGNTRTRSRAHVARMDDVFQTFDHTTNSYQMSKYRHRVNKARGSQSVPPVPAHWPLALTAEDLKELEAIDVSPFLPKHHHQVNASPLRRECENGQIKELQECVNRDVFGPPVVRQGDWVVIGLMWVYTVKAKDEMYNRVRSRITLMGNQEKVDLSPWQAYAPVAQVTTGRIMVATHLGSPGVRFRKIDVKNAYINENMRRTVYTKMPPGYTFFLGAQGNIQFRALAKGESHDPMLCLPLKKALYGGMECGRIFWEAWTDWHLTNGFSIIHEERCYLVRYGPNGTFIKMAYHVDDNMIAIRGDEYYEQYLTDLKVRFDVTEEALEENLGLKYDFSQEGDVSICRITQTPQIKKFLTEFDIMDCTATSAPCLGNKLPCKEDCEEKWDGEDWDMLSFVGHGTYLQMCTRPDISLVMKLLSRFTTNYGKKHVLWAKHLLRYLKGTLALGLTYRSGFPLFLQIFTDASHASCVDTRRSILSMVAKLGGNTIYWKSCFSSIVSHSSTESELMALDMGATIEEGLGWLTESMGGPRQHGVQIFVDNTGTITISQNPVQAGRNLHVHARYFYVRDLAYSGAVMVIHLPTARQVADVGCTFKGGPSYLKLRQYLMECARVVHDASGNSRWEFCDGDLEKENLD